MECLDALELATAAIDGELGDGARTELDAHLSMCASCGAALELERMTKSVIRSRFQSVRAPAHLVTGIKNQLAAEYDGEKASESWYQQWFASRRRVAIVAMGALAAFILLINNPLSSSHLHTKPFDGDIVHQTFNNFDRFRDGSMKPEVQSANPSIVQAFFSKNANFSAKVLRVNSSELLGGGCSQYKQETIAHVIYKYEGELIYVYQATLKSVEDGTSLQISPKILSELKSGGKYVQSNILDCTLIVWLVDSTVCCAVADIQKDKLLASLQENY